MESNVSIKSNVYIKTGHILDDIDFMRQIRGEKALRLLLEKLNLSIDDAKTIGLTKEQLMELEGGSKCLINDPYGGAYGPIAIENGQEIMEFRCIREECEVYEECMGLKVADVEGSLKQEAEDTEVDKLFEDEIIEASIIEEEKEDPLSAEVDTIMKEILNLYNRLETIKKELKDKN
ncbi:MAG: hypothetical protein ACLFPS_05535 [Clostridia bacterium]